jgi:hypothetical protein
VSHFKCKHEGTEVILNLFSVELRVSVANKIQPGTLSINPSNLGTMANKHYRTWLFQLPLGLIFSAGSIFILMFAIKKAPAEQWVMLTIVSALSLVIGLFLFGNAIIHKVKSDFIKKGKKRHSAATVVEREEQG